MILLGKMYISLNNLKKNTSKIDSLCIPLPETSVKVYIDTIHLLKNIVLYVFLKIYLIYLPILICFA